MPDFGDGSAREGYGEVDPYAPSVSNGQISPEQWAEYQKKRHRDALLGILATVGGATGLGFAGQALGGAAAGSPQFGIGAANTGTWANSVGAAPGLAGGAAGAGTGAAAGAAGGAATKIANGGGMIDDVVDVGKKTMGGLSATDLISLGTALTGLIGGSLANNNTSTTPTTATSDPQLKELMALMQGRLKKSEPLYDSALSMANGLLPTQYQRPNPLIGG